MLEVVEEEERSRPVECLGDGLQRGPAGRLAHAERSGDRLRHDVRVRDGGEPDEVNRALERGCRRDLEREPALTGPARAGDRDEPDVRSAEKLADALERRLASDQAVMERREARRTERAEWRELDPQPGRHELEELRSGRNVLQPMPAEGAVLAAGQRLVSGDVPRRTRDDDLLAVRRCADPRGDDDVDPDVALVHELGLARVNADPEPQRLVGRPRLVGEGALDLAADATASRAPGNARKTPSPAQSTS